MSDSTNVKHLGYTKRIELNNGNITITFNMDENKKITTICMSNYNNYMPSYINLTTGEARDICNILQRELNNAIDN